MVEIEILILVFLLSDLAVTAARAGLLNLRYGKLLSMRAESAQQVDATLDAVKRRARLRATLKLTQTLLRFLIAGGVLAVFVPWQTFELPTLTVTGLLVTTAILIWLGEFLVERQVLMNPEIWAMRLTPLAQVLGFVLAPVLVLPTLLAGRRNTAAGQLVTITEEELKSLVDASQRAGVLEQDERQMIFSIFQFGDTLAREIMVPRINVFSVDADTLLEEATREVIESGHSRVPVYDGQPDNIIGLVYTKDLLRAWRIGDAPKTLREMLRPAHFVPEAKKVAELLAEMQARRVHMAIVVDEYGGVAGLVTMENIVEEIFGEIRDEYDEGEELPYQKVADGEYLFNGQIALDDFNEVMGSQLGDEEADSLGGLIYSRLGRVPKVGEIIHEDGLELTVEKISARRIQKVRARRAPAKHPNESKERSNDAH